MFNETIYLPAPPAVYKTYSTRFTAVYQIAYIHYFKAWSVNKVWTKTN